MIREHKKTLIIGSLLILLPVPIALALGRKSAFLLWMPLSLLAVYWLCIFATGKDPKQKNQGKKIQRMVLWIVPVISLLLCTMDVFLSRGVALPITTVFCLLFGGMFMAIGNYLPKCRQNYTIGIKVSWAYTSEENWNATHRFGGKVWFLGGLVILLGALLPAGWAVALLFTAIFTLALLPIFYSYWYYRRQKARGDELAPMPKLISSQFGKFTPVFFAVLAVFLYCVMFTGNITYQFEEESFTIHASYFDDLTVNYEDIEELSFREENYPGFRVWGYGSFRLLMGTFQTENTQYTRYTYYRPDSAVALTVKGKPLVISGKDPQETKAIYETLLQKMES